MFAIAVQVIRVRLERDMYAAELVSTRASVATAAAIMADEVEKLRTENDALRTSAERSIIVRDNAEQRMQVRLGEPAVCLLFPASRRPHTA